MNARKTKCFVWRMFALVGLAVGMTVAGFGAVPALPQILSTRVSGTNLLVSVSIPKGWASVTLESREQANAGAWVPRAIARTSGKSVFRIPATVKGQLLRVQGQLRDPLPAHFYRGKHTFATRSSSFLRPDQGSGQVFSVAADGALAGNATVPTMTAANTATPTVEESDIWAFNGNTLYFFNQLRGLQVIDVSNPDNPVVTGRLEWPAVGEQMYSLDAQHVLLLAQDSCTGTGQSQVAVVDVSGATPRVVATLPIQGWLQDSRLVGTALYVVAEGYYPAAATWTTSPQWGAVVTSFDLSNPAAPVSRSMLFYPGNANAILATDHWLFVATQDWSSGAQSVVRVIDCSAADGTLTDLSGITTAGEVADKYKLNVNGTTFTAISDTFQMTNDFSGAWVTTLETFSLANPTAPAALGSLQLAYGDELNATSFDGTRAYIATAQQTDPLWVVDLSDPTTPSIAGSVDVPGWSTYIKPMGNRLLTLGVETNLVAVSLFDVSDPTAPTLLSQVFLGENYSWSDALADDKVLTVLSDLGLVLVPYSGATTNGWTTQVQLIDLGASTLTARGQINQPFAPSRTAAHGGRVLSLANEDLLTVDITDEDHPLARSDLALAWPVNQLFVQGDYLVELTAGSGWSGAAQPAIRIAPAASPDAVVSSLGLTNMAITGATVKDGRLFVLQSPDNYYPILYGGPIMLGAGGLDPSATNLVMTIVDLSALPALNVLGQVAVSPATSAPAGGSYQALWPSPNTLVWFSSGFSFWVNPIFAAQPLNHTAVPVVGLAVSGVNASRPVATNTLVAGKSPATTTALRPTTLGAPQTTLNTQAFSLIPYWWPWWNNGGVQLLAFDVSDPTNPQLTSSLNYNPTNTWGFSQPLAAQGLVFFSHEQSGYSGPSGSTWRVSEFLDVIDYTDPTTPTTRPSISVAGQLAGLSPEASLVYLWGNDVTSGGNWVANRTGVAACSYDGVAAYLVATLPLPKTWPQPVVIQDNVVYLGRAAADGTSGTLESWSFSATGQFGLNYKVTVTSPLSALAVVGGAVLALDANNNLNRFDLGTGALVTSTSPPGCTWLNLNRADGTLPSALFIPLDDYGVFAVP